MENLILEEKVINTITQSLSKDITLHTINSNLYQTLKIILSDTIDSLYDKNKAGKFNFSVFGNIELPYISFGNINTKHLFGIDEIIIFTYYYLNKERYKTVLDLGANIGLHSLIMSKCFKKIYSYEPDDFHYDCLNNTIEKNFCTNVELNKKAVSNFNGVVEFTRVKGNTTGSHISGSKENVYGEIDKFEVPCVSLETIIEEKKPDFIKMDVEGQEKNILTNTNISYFNNVDIMVEIGNEENAKAVFEYFKGTKIKLFSQKNSWSEVKVLSDMPTSHREGSLFISEKDMQWK